MFLKTAEAYQAGGGRNTGIFQSLMKCNHDLFEAEKVCRLVKRQQFWVW
jgi:hypothetical protein